MLNGDNQGNGNKSIVLISPPRTHPPPPQTNLVNTYLICDSPLQRSARRSLVCYTAVFSVVTQRSSSQSGEERCVATLKTAV